MLRITVNGLKHTYINQLYQGLSSFNTGSAYMSLAVSAFKYPPMRARMTQVAAPLNKGAVGLDHLEGVWAVRHEGHIE